MLQLDVSNAELVTLNRNDENVEVIIRFTDCPDVVLTANETDTILIFHDKLTIMEEKEPESSYKEETL